MNITKKNTFLILAIATFLSANAYCIENISVRSPISSPTVPQSSLRNSQTPARVEKYTDYGGYGNDIVTGNVAGGRHFRGFVPYNSVSDFGGRLGSDDLDSFIRRSAGNPYSSQASGVTESYHLPSKTVSSFNRGQASGLLPPQITFSGGTGDYAITPLSQIEIERQRPFSTNLEDIERKMNRDLTLLRLKEKIEKNLLQENLRMEENLRIEENLLTEVRPKQSELDDLLQIQDIKPQEPLLQDEPLDPQTELIRKRKLDQIKDEDLNLSLLEKMDPEELEQLLGQKFTESKDKIKIPKRQPLPEADHKKAKEIRGKHESFDKLAKAKYDEYMLAVEKFMKEGMPYKAADACTLASVWMPKEPGAYGAKGLALFAAGEYMSSSYFIQRAITLSPDYLKEKIILKEKIDPDLMENRLLDATGWQRLTDSSELAFLLAFIRYHQENFDEANEMIIAAQNKMPDNIAVKTLKEAIENAL